MKKFLIAFTGFIIGLYVFMPKNELFYFLQNRLTKNGINIITNTESDISKLTLTDGKIYYSSIKVATFKKAILHPYIFYNTLTVKNIRLPVNNLIIRNVVFKQNILKPNIVFIKAQANFAKNINGYIDVFKREIKIYFSDIKNFNIKKLLKKDKKGYYYYEKF